MLEEELQKIHDSEINLEIRWMWDAGIDIKLGDEMNGHKAEGNVRTVSVASGSHKETLPKRPSTTSIA
jgi:hypothetical protein